jgi:hypothetical protein
MNFCGLLRSAQECWDDIDVFNASPRSRPIG